MSLRSSTIDAGVVSSLAGRFLTNMPIYVWCGDGWSSVVQAIVVSETQLISVAPAVSEPGVRHVRVRFATDETNGVG